MRVVIDGLYLNTATYAEDDEIAFTFYTADDGDRLALTEALADDGQVLELRRGDEQIPVRVREHEVTPPYSGRYDGAIHRHSVRLARAGAAVLPFPAGAIHTRLAAVAAAR